jgi:hypothetical protein
MGWFDREAPIMLIDEKTAHMVSPHPCKGPLGPEILNNGINRRAQFGTIRIKTLAER